ncbi:MAG: PulJ/GspJ family protein [Lactobacillus sp.]
MKRQVSAFTLLETMISLVITALVLTLGTMTLNYYHKRLAFTNSAKTVVMAVEQAMRVATINQHAVVMTPLTGAIQVKGIDYQRQIKIDPKTRVEFSTRQHGTLVITSSGYVAPAAITFIHKRFSPITYNIQMNWGRISLDETTR